MEHNKSFTEYLAEADISTGSIDKAFFLITKYLKRKTGLNFFKLPGVEKFSNSKGKGYGARFFDAKKNFSIRFNVDSSQMTSRNITSVDIWLNSKTPIHIKYDRNVSFVKIIPGIANILKTKKIPTVMYTLPDNVPLNEGFSGEQNLLIDMAIITEATTSGDVIEAQYLDIVDMISSPNFSKGKIYRKYKSSGSKMFDALEDMFPKFIVKNGTKFAWEGNKRDLAKVKKAMPAILDEIGATKATVSKGSAKETIAATGNTEELMANREKLTFEAQLADLENLLKLTISGASNAIFISGRGGVGKTHTTEQILSQMGLRDGAGYFKNTGSASAAGLYLLLFQNKDGIVFFDDSDDALKDQSARNLLKAATDTKKIRKLVWNKMGANVANPDEMTDDEILASGQIPRWFEFTGKIIFISNLPLNKLDPDGALRTRAFIIDINPTDVEVYDFMEKIVDKIKLEEGLSLDMKERKRVVGLLRKGVSAQTANLRKLSRGLNMAAGAIQSGVAVSDSELQRMIETYA